MPVDKKQLGKRADDPARAPPRTPRTATWSRSSVAAAAAFGLPTARVEERLGSLEERARGQPDRDPRPRASRTSFRSRRWPRREAAQAAPASPAARTGASCRSSPSIRPTPRTTTTRSTPRPTPIRTIRGGHIVTVAIADVAHYVTAGLGARPRGAEARQLGLFPRPRRADAARAHLQRSVLAARRARTAPRSPCAWSSAPTAASARTRFHRVLMRSAAKLNYAQAQAAIDGRTDEDDRPAARQRARAALRRLRGAQARARRARAARPRPARAQDPAQGRRHGRSRRHAGAARSAPADRGVHDPRQRRGGRDAGAARACR